MANPASWIGTASKEASARHDQGPDLGRGFRGSAGRLPVYEAQEPGLGEYFAASLRADIEGLKVTGGIHRVVFKDYHRLLGRVFPYAIYYTCGNQVVTIWAVIDCRRDPDWIRKHLDA